MNIPKPLQSIIRAALAAVDAKDLVHNYLVDHSSEILSGHNRLFVVGAGKAAVPMALGCEAALGRQIHAGLVITKEGHDLQNGEQLHTIAVKEGSHPLLDRRGLAASEQLLALVDEARADDVVLFLLSGGTSALLESLPAGVTLDDYRDSVQQLLHGGVDIAKLNQQRKRYSLVKGGQLADRIQPATFRTLLLSDVVGDDLATIGSGPTYREELADHHVMLANNNTAVAAATNEANRLGYKVTQKENVTGEADEIANLFVDQLHIHEANLQPNCLIWGGETTVTVRGDGLGGRNQQFALACIEPLSKLKRKWSIASFGTDGNDGPTDAAGAFLTPETLAKVAQMRLNVRQYLDRNNAYSFFEQVGGLIKSGPTRTNVMDIMVALAE